MEILDRLEVYILSYYILKGLLLLFAIYIVIEALDRAYKKTKEVFQKFLGFFRRT